MLFGADLEAAIRLLKLEQRDYSVSYELCSEGSANESGEFVRANGKILFNLDHVQLIAAAFGLHWENVMCTLFVESDIEFIDLHLPHPWDGGSQMVLQRVTGHTGKDINQAIVAETRQQSLLVAKRVFRDDAWCRIRNFCRRQI